MDDTDMTIEPPALGHAAGKRRASIGAQRNPDSAEAILDAAGALLREAGYRGFSIEAVARRAGAGKPTIYRWWPSKAALLFDVYEREKAEGIPVPDTGALESDLIVLMTGIWRHWRDTPAGRAFSSLVAESQGDPEAVRELERRFQAVRRRYVEAVLARAAERGEIAPERIDAAAGLFSGFNWYRLLTGQLDDESAIAPSVKVIVEGVRRR